MTPRDEVIGTLARHLLHARRGHPLRVGVDGPSGVGKSTFARDPVATLGRAGHPAVHVDSDGFHHVRAHRRRNTEDPARGYYEDAYDFPALAEQVLRPLGPGGSRRFATTVHDLAADAVIAEANAVAPADCVVVFDCTFLQVPALRELWDVVLYLDADDTVASARGVARDSAALGGDGAARAAYDRRYLAAWRLYVDEVDPRSRADVVIDHTDPASPALLTAP